MKDYQFGSNSLVNVDELLGLYKKLQDATKYYYSEVASPNPEKESSLGLLASKPNKEEERKKP